MVVACSGAFGHTLGTRPVACGTTPDLGKPLRASFPAFLQLGLRVLLGSIQGESGLAARSVSPCLGAWVASCWVAWGCGGRGFKPRHPDRTLVAGPGRASLRCGRPHRGQASPVLYVAALI
jgi:hypothetical protein